MLKKSLPLIIALILLVLGLAFGFFLGLGWQSKNQESNNPQASKELRYPSGFFSSETASLRGEIVAKEGNVLTIKNLNTQVVARVQISDRAVITNPGKTPPTSDPASIELNKEALIGLEGVDGDYKIISIQFTLPSPSLPPIVKSDN